MKNILLKYVCLLFLVLPASLLAQDITGLWKGEMYVDSTKKYLPYEIAISEVNGKLVGYSLITFEENGKQETGTRDIIIELKDKKIIIEDVSLIDNSFKFVPPKNIKKVMVVTLSVEDTMMVMKGDWSTNKTKRFLAATGTVTLQRKTDFKASVLYKKLADLMLVDKLVFNEPKAAAPKIEAAPQIPIALINPDVKKQAVVKEKVIAAAKPKEDKKIIPIVLKPAPVIVAVETKPVTIKKPEPVIEKAVAPAVVIVAVAKPIQTKPVAPTATKETPPKPVPAPTIAVALKAPPVQKPLPVIEKQVPTQVAVSKPVITEKTIAPVMTAIQKSEPIKAPSASEGAEEINKRSIASTQSVFYESDSLVLTLYDNGYVDGDTVSVVMNGEVIFSKQGLSTKAVSKTIHINKDTPDSITLVMYAENLGSIPPNTGLLVVHDGENIYDVRFSADLKSNAAIILRRKK
ncbi:MAG: hypothetical protein H7334_11790 [Ferruginibacter sp.]|nr:hypothetical protein [Ferruginibacter sp.]